MGCMSSTPHEQIDKRAMYNTDFSQVSPIPIQISPIPIEHKEESFILPTEYRVVVDPGANCRVNISRSSLIVAQLPIGTSVMVDEIVDYSGGSRARISSPKKGWISMRSQLTDRIILEPASEQNDFSKQSSLVKQWMYSIKFTDRKTLDCTRNEIYFQKLLQNGFFNMQKIEQLTDDNLKNIGIENAKDRGKILAAKQWKQKTDEQQQKQEQKEIVTDSESDDRMEEFEDDIIPRLCFHIHGPGLTQVSFKKQSVIQLFENCVAQTVETELTLENTVHELHHIIKKYFGIAFDAKILLLYAHSVLSDDTDFYLTLRDCGITNHSFFVVAVHNYIGKDTVNDDNFLDFEEHKRLIWSKSMQRGISLDVITRDSRANVYRMPFCGHSMSKNSLYHYVLSEYETKKEIVKCPHTKNNSKQLCEQNWDYPTIKKYLLSIPEEEKKEKDDFVKYGMLELLSSRNVVENHFNLQKCGCCNTLYYREKNENDNCIKLDVECMLCKNRFCWGCSEKWNNSHFCDNGGIRNEAIKILNGCSTKTIGLVNGVPEIRACPNCYQLITHTEACKHVKCIGCKKDFCFVCLKMKDGNDEWQCGAYDARCTIHSRQNDSLPRLQNETTFHLF